MFRTVLGGFLIVWLECRKLTVTYEDILIAWVRRPGVEIVVEEATSGLLEKIDEVYPF